MQVTAIGRRPARTIFLVSQLVAANAEGRAIGGQNNGPAPRIPFTAEVIERLDGRTEPIQAAGATVLQLAWYAASENELKP